VILQPGGQPSESPVHREALLELSFRRAGQVQAGRIAPLLLPHVLDRPITFVRFPNGVDGQKFFQKNTDASAPDWLPTVELRGGGSRRGADSEEIPSLSADPRAGGARVGG
jgi:hypothetical protein